MRPRLAGVYLACLGLRVANMTKVLNDLPMDILRAICCRHRVRELALFGSALREDFGPDSDIDLLVEFEPDARIGFMELGALEQEIERVLGRKVDLGTKRSLRPFLREAVLSSARVLFTA